MNIGDVDFNGLFPLIALLVSICGLILFRSLSRSNFDLHRKIGAITTIGISGIIAIFEIGRWRKFDRGLIEKKDTVTLNGFVSTDRLSTISVLILSLVLIIVTLSAVTYLKNRIDWDRYHVTHTQLNKFSAPQLVIEEQGSKATGAYQYFESSDKLAEFFEALTKINK